MADEIDREAFERAVADNLIQILVDDEESMVRLTGGVPAPYSAVTTGSYPDTVLVVDRGGAIPHTWEFDLWDPVWRAMGVDPLNVATEMFLMKCDD